MEASLKEVLRSKPWLALGFGLLIQSLGFVSTPVAEGLLFKRAEIFQGQLWRLWTAHGLHFGWSHLGWNLLVFIVAATWIERLSRRSLVWLLLLSPLAISCGLLLCCPSLSTYAGLSGVDTSLIAFLGIACLRQNKIRVGAALLTVLLIKTGAEYSVGSSLFSGFRDPTVQSVPLSHVFGMIVGILVGLMPRRFLKLAASGA